MYDMWYMAYGIWYVTHIYTYTYIAEIAFFGMYAKDRIGGKFMIIYVCLNSDLKTNKQNWKHNPPMEVQLIDPHMKITMNSST